MFKIEKNIKVKGRTPRGESYPFKDMEVGDSFLIPDVGNKKSQIRNTIYNYANYIGLHGCFATRTEGNGIRVWKVKEKEV